MPSIISPKPPMIDIPPVSANRITKVELAYAVFAFTGDIDAKYKAGTGTVDPQEKIGDWFYYTTTGTYTLLPSVSGIPADIKWIDTFGGDTSSLTTKTAHFLSSYIDETLSFTNNWATIGTGFTINDSTMPHRVRVWMRITYVVESVTNVYVTSPKDVVLNATAPFTFGTIKYGGTRESVTTTSVITGTTLTQMETTAYVWGGVDGLDMADYTQSAGNSAPTGRSSAYGIVYLDANGNVAPGGQYLFPSPQISIGNIVALPNDVNPTPGYITSTHPQRHLLPSYWTPILFYVDNQHLPLGIGHAGDTLARVIFYEYGEYPNMMGIPVDDTDHNLVYSITALEGLVRRKALLLLDGEKQFSIPVRITCPGDNELTAVTYDVELVGESTEVYWQNTATQEWTRATCVNAGNESIIPDTPTTIADITSEGIHNINLAIDVDKLRAQLPVEAAGNPVAVRVAVTVSGADIDSNPAAPIDTTYITLYVDMRAGSFSVADVSSAVYGSTLTTLKYTLNLPYPSSAYAFDVNDFDFGFNNNSVLLSVGKHAIRGNVGVMQNNGLSIAYTMSGTTTLTSGSTVITGNYKSDMDGIASTAITITTVTTNDLSLLTIDQASLFNLDKATTSIATVVDATPQ